MPEMRRGVSHTDQTRADPFWFVCPPSEPSRSRFVSSSLAPSQPQSGSVAFHVAGDSYTRSLEEGWREELASRVMRWLLLLYFLTTQVEAIATRVGAIASRVEAIASRVEAIATNCSEGLDTRGSRLSFTPSESLSATLQGSKLHEQS